VAIVNVTVCVFHGPVIFSECLIIYLKSAVYIKRFVIINRYMTRRYHEADFPDLLNSTYRMDWNIRNIRNCSSLWNSLGLFCEHVRCWAQKSEN